MRYFFLFFTFLILSIGTLVFLEEKNSDYPVYTSALS
jgi:hypothetical protein